MVSFWLMKYDLEPWDLLFVGFQLIPNQPDDVGEAFVSRHHVPPSLEHLKIPGWCKNGISLSKISQQDRKVAY